MRVLATLAILLALARAEAFAELRVEVIGTDPAMPAEVARDQPVSIRLAYSGAEGHQFWVRPYLRGQPVARVKTNPSRRYSGSGEALGWFSLDEAGEVDEIRIRTGGSAGGYRESEILSFAMSVRGTGQPGTQPRPAAWVEALRKENDAAHRAERKKESERPFSVFDTLFGMGFMLAVLGTFAGSVILPIWAVKRWRGPWRVAAALPLLGMGFVAARIVFDTARDPTSHNLWPFEILYAGVPGLAFLALLALLRRLFKRGG